MLIVLAIIGVMASIATLSIGAATRGASPEAEARRLASHVRLAMDEALVTDNDIVLVWDDTGYVFQARAAGTDQWAPYGVAALGTRHDLSAQLHIETDTQSRQLRIAPNGDGDVTTLKISGSEAGWHVVIDGYSAIASSGQAL